MKQLLQYFLLTSFLLAVCGDLSAQSSVNPILPGITDQGAMRYNGNYYSMGCGTGADLFHSSDMVTWEREKDVCHMDNAWATPYGIKDNHQNAGHICYYDGVFYRYWHSDHWGEPRQLVHLTYALSDKIFGPYVEPVKDTWYDNRIDLMIFRDDNGDFYQYNVKFDDGNAIWCTPMKTPVVQAAPPISQFASHPKTWERMDNKVAEGPWVVKYRDNYYMMYVCNHTWGECGNYQIGVAVSDRPDNFNHGAKYPYPVMTSNQYALEDRHNDLLVYGAEYQPYIKYATDSATIDGWMKSDFDDTLWSEGRDGIATKVVEGSTVYPSGTIWDSSLIRVRKHFKLKDASSVKKLALRILHSTNAKVWLNGELIYDVDGSRYHLVELERSVCSALRDGENVLAVESSRTNLKSNAYLNFALFDMGDDTVEKIMYTPGQPNLFKGPNGIEWWNMYMANVVNEPRSQFVTRVHFADRRLYSEAIADRTGHEWVSIPSAPQFREDYPGEGFNALTSKMIDQSLASSSYYFETMLKGTGKFEIVLCQYSNGKKVSALIDAATGDITIGKNHFQTPVALDWSVQHQITVWKNAGYAKLSIDELVIEGCQSIALPSEAAAVPGIAVKGGKAENGTIIYTVGWDEYDENIAGWKAGKGRFIVDGNGLSSDAPFTAFKSEPCDSYDFSTQVYAPASGTAGCYPLYVDGNNYVKADIDRNSAKLTVTVCKDGSSSVSEYSLSGTKPFYADVKYSDRYERGYSFEKGTVIDKIILPKVSFDDPTQYVEDVFKHYEIDYLKDGKWTRLNPTVTSDSKYCYGTFDPVQVERLRFVQCISQDHKIYIYRILCNEISKESYHLHFVREKDNLVVRVDGKNIAMVPVEEFAPSVVGLCSDGESRFNGIVYFRK